MTAQQGNGTRLTPRRRTGVRPLLSVIAVLGLIAAAGCGDEDDGEGEDGGEATTQVEGTFVGEVSKSDGFVGIVVSPVGEGSDRTVDAFVCDGEAVCEWFSGSAADNEFTIDSDDGDATVTGTLSGDGVKGTIELGGGSELTYKTEPAAAVTGVYELKVADDGDLRGASATGVALKGESSLPEPGPGTLELADGEQLELEISANTDSDPVGLKPGQVRLIILPDGELRGAGVNPEDPDGGASEFFVRSSSGE